MNSHLFNHENCSGSVTISLRVVIIFIILLITVSIIAFYYGYRQCAADVENAAMNISQERFEKMTARVDSIAVECDVNRKCWSDLVREVKGVKRKAKK